MPFKPGDKRPENAGRKKGSLNKSRQTALEIAERLKVDPLEILLLVAKADWETLGYDSPEITKYTKEGQQYFEDRITLQDRVQAARGAIGYIHAQKKAVEVKGDLDVHNDSPQMEKQVQELKELLLQVKGVK